MREDVKKFIESAVNNGKDKKYVRDYLYGKIGELELARALIYFDSLQSGRKKTIREIFILSLSFLRIFLFYLAYLFLKMLVFLKKLVLMEKKEKIDIEGIKQDFNFENFLGKFYSWYSKKSPKERKRMVLSGVIFLIVFVFFVYANFFYYKECENLTCFKDRMERCERAVFTSEDFITLENKITGRSFNKCNSVVFYRDPEKNKKIFMTCSFPINYRSLPYSNLEFCSGELREVIQSKIISEMHSIVGENIVELNSFFKK